MTDDNPIGTRIAVYRKRAGYDKAADLAAAITNDRITTSVIQNIESGRKADISVTQLLEISYALGVSPLFLLAPMSKRMDRVGLPNVSDPIASMTVDDFDRWVALIPGAPLPQLDFEHPWAWSASVAVRLLRDLADSVREWDELGDPPTEDDAILLRGDGSRVIFDEMEHYDLQLGQILSRINALLGRLQKYPTVDLEWLPADLVRDLRAYEENIAAEHDRAIAEARRDRNLEDAESIDPGSGPHGDD